jgi:cytochrome c556
MKSIYAALATGTILAAAAMAQEEHVVFDKMAPQIKLMGLQGSIMGKTVKGAPYSAVEVTENTQMLADGTRIHNESQTQVYRDSEGRLRRETPTEITIWDPVANASWVLNPKDKTARKLPMGNFVYTSTRTANGETATYVVRSDEKGFRTSDETRVVEQKLAAAREADPAKIKAELEAHMRQPGPGGVGIAVAATAGPNGEVMRRTMVMKQKMNTDQLGKRTIEGVSAEGTRMTATIEAGAIGNDRAINTVTERWFSPELQTVMLTRTTDPRSGEESFKLVNVNRSEPASYLFQVPAGYQVIEAK